MKIFYSVIGCVVVYVGFFFFQNSRFGPSELINTNSTNHTYHYQVNCSLKNHLT